MRWCGLISSCGCLLMPAGQIRLLSIGNSCCLPNLQSITFRAWITLFLKVYEDELAQERWPNNVEIYELCAIRVIGYKEWSHLPSTSKAVPTGCDVLFCSSWKGKQLIDRSVDQSTMEWWKAPFHCHQKSAGHTNRAWKWRAANDVWSLSPSDQYHLCHSYLLAFVIL